METVKTKRPTGFSKKTGVSTVNQAYSNYLMATGTTKKEGKGKFKEWLKKQKESGNLQKLLQAGAGVASTLAANQMGNAERTVSVPASEANYIAAPTVEEPTKIMGMSVPVFIGVSVLVVAVVVTGVVIMVKRSKKGA